MLPRSTGHPRTTTHLPAPCRPPLDVRAFAHALLDDPPGGAGVDVFFGHSAHVTQGVELYKGKPIIDQARRREKGEAHHRNVAALLRDEGRARQLPSCLTVVPERARQREGVRE